jgi:hypothetical protein
VASSTPLSLESKLEVEDDEKCFVCEELVEDEKCMFCLRGFLHEELGCCRKV